jgi:tRNA threonylcarbamoyl adenosine modification protein YeaZ
MRVLAIDTALEACSAAVLDSQRGGIVARESHEMLRGHAEALMPLIARVMSASDIAFAELDRVVVTIGPGSFTGLRVGVAAARGIALAASKTLIGVTTLAAFAAPHVAADDSKLLLSVIDARHEQVYLQLIGPGGRTLIAPRMAALADAAHMAAAEPVRIVGTAAKLVEAAWPAGAAPPLMVNASRAPDIDWVAQLGGAAEEQAALPKPLYLRAPDARPQDAGRIARR